jgi:hypothetical protein
MNVGNRERPNICPYCDGQGILRRNDPVGMPRLGEVCRTCRGSGKLNAAQMVIVNHLWDTVEEMLEEQVQRGELERHPTQPDRFRDIKFKGQPRPDEE